MQLNAYMEKEVMTINLAGCCVRETFDVETMYARFIYNTEKSLWVFVVKLIYKIAGGFVECGCTFLKRGLWRLIFFKQDSFSK